MLPLWDILAGWSGFSDNWIGAWFGSERREFRDGRHGFQAEYIGSQAARRHYLMRFTSSRTKPRGQHQASFDNLESACLPKTWWTHGDINSTQACLEPHKADSSHSLVWLESGAGLGWWGKKNKKRSRETFVKINVRSARDQRHHNGTGLDLHCSILPCSIQDGVQFSRPIVPGCGKLHQCLKPQSPESRPFQIPNIRASGCSVAKLRYLIYALS